MNSRSAAASTRSRQHAAWTLGRWIAAGALEQADIEDELYMAALHNGLVHDDGQRQTWGTIHSGLGAGPQQPIDLDADARLEGGLRSERGSASCGAHPDTWPEQAGRR